ncbi:hypothetical protein Tco_1232372 [Tanacetum coccineum]
MEEYNPPHNTLELDSISEFICPWRECGDPGLPWVVDDKTFRTRAYKEYNQVGVLKAVRNAHRASSSLSDHEAQFSPTVLSRIVSSHDLKPPLVHSFVDDKR